MQNEVWGWDLNSLHPTTVHWKIFTNSYMKFSPSTDMPGSCNVEYSWLETGGGWKNSPIPMLSILAWEWNYIWILFVSILTLTNTPSQSHLHTCTHPHNHIFTHAHTLTFHIYSWGPKWGQNGYFMLVRGKGKCGIDTGVTSVVLE